MHTKKVRVKLPGIRKPVPAKVDPESETHLSQHKADQIGKLVYPHKKRAKRRKLWPAGKWVSAYILSKDNRVGYHYRLVPVAWIR